MTKVSSCNGPQPGKQDMVPQSMVVSCTTLVHMIGQMYEVKQLRTSPYHPESNGMLERFHATLKVILRR